MRPESIDECDAITFGPHQIDKIDFVRRPLLGLETSL